MVFYAEPISDILGPMASAAVYLFAMKRILEKRRREPVDNIRNSQVEVNVEPF